MEKGKAQNSAPGRHERRLVTALCYDLVGSTGLLSHSDVEDFDELILAFLRDARTEITSRGASLREVGDGGVAVFPIEIDARDAASLAINAGLKIVDACARVGREKGRADMHVRVGIATSMGLLRDDREKPSPDNMTAIALAMATRLQAMAEPDTVLVSRQTRVLAHRSHVFSFQGVRQFKGVPEPEQTWRALHHKLEVGRFHAFGRLSTPTVGREAELRVAAECWGAAAAGSGNVLFIEGEAGMGKSRLLHDVRRIARQKRKRVLMYQCWPSGTHSALHPILESLPDVEGRPTVSLILETFGRFGIEDEDVVDVFSFLLGAEGLRDQTLKDAGPEVIEERVRHALHRAIEQLCAKGPIVIAVEDVHWSDATSRHLLVELANVIDRYPVLLVLTARPESGERVREDAAHEARPAHAPQPRRGPQRHRRHVAAEQVGRPFRPGGCGRPHHRRRSALHRGNLPLDGGERRFHHRAADTGRISGRLVYPRKSAERAAGATRRREGCRQRRRGRGHPLQSGAVTRSRPRA